MSIIYCHGQQILDIVHSFATYCYMFWPFFSHHHVVSTVTCLEKNTELEVSPFRFDVHVTVHRVKFLIIKPTGCTHFSNLFLEWNSTCFGQFLCPPVPSWSCSQAVSKPVWHISLLCVQWKTPDGGQRNCPKHVDFHSKNKFEKLVHLVGFIIRKLPFRVNIFIYIKLKNFRLLFPILYTVFWLRFFLTWLRFLLP
jgi:hypothetical protein